MTAKPIALAKAREAKARAFTRIAELEQQVGNLQRLIVCIFDHSNTEAMVLDDEELCAADPNRAAMANIGADGGKWVVGVKKNASDPLVIGAFAKKALEAVTEVSGDGCGTGCSPVYGHDFGTHSDEELLALGYDAQLIQRARAESAEASLPRYPPCPLCSHPDADPSYGVLPDGRPICDSCQWGELDTRPICDRCVEVGGERRKTYGHWTASHTDEELLSRGFGAEDIARLRADGRDLERAWGKVPDAC